MGTANYIGRVGGLAVALGIGFGVVLAPAVAFADRADSGSTASADSPSARSGAKSSAASSRRSGVTGLEGHRRQPLASAARGQRADHPSTPGIAAARVAPTAAVPGPSVRLPKVTVGGAVAGPAASAGGAAAVNSTPAVDPTPSLVSGPTTAVTSRYAQVEPPAQRSLRVLDRQDVRVSSAQVVAVNASASQLASESAPVETQPATFTGKASVISQVFSAVFAAVGALGNAVGTDLSFPVTRLLMSARPPWITTMGLTVQSSEFEGMPVWTLQSSDPSGKEVVGIHGGALILQPLIFNWLSYAAIARETGATVIVPIYPLVPQGTARTVVPAMADLISAHIDDKGADNVSVFGDSSGANIALTAVQELVRRGHSVPTHMVLASPPLDASLSNPAIPLVHDALFSSRHTVAVVLDSSRQWADGLDPSDPLVSPLFGSLAGLPSTTVYAGSRDVVAPDVLLLQDKAAATPGADFSFVLRKGEPHDFAVVTLLPETRALMPDIYRQLGLTS